MLRFILKIQKHKEYKLDIRHGRRALSTPVFCSLQLPVGIIESFRLEESSLFWEGKNSRKNFRPRVSLTYRSF